MFVESDDVCGLIFSGKVRPVEEAARSTGINLHFGPQGAFSVIFMGIVFAAES